jgi:hypothetical protein
MQITYALCVILLLHIVHAQKIFNNSTTDSQALFPTASIVAASVEGFVVVVGLTLGIALLVRNKLAERAMKNGDA